MMRRPVVGVIGNAFRAENRYDTQLVGERNLRAVADVAQQALASGAPAIRHSSAVGRSRTLRFIICSAISRITCSFCSPLSPVSVSRSPLAVWRRW